MSTERIYIQRSEEFEARREGTYSQTGGMSSIGSVVNYAPDRQSNSDFQIKYELDELQRPFDGDIPDDVLDLIEIATATFGVDRYLKRKIIAGTDVEDEDARFNTRSIVLRIPVFTSALTTTKAQELLSTILSHMTYDVIEYELIKHPKSSNVTTGSFETTNADVDAISLFSDGLDSAGGVHQNRATGTNSEYISLNYGGGLGSNHEKMQDLLDVDPSIFKLEYDGTTNEYTTFSRGFLHWVFAAAAAVADRVPEVRAFETGLMARFAILNEGWQTTRTVSPVAVDLFNTLLTEVLDWNTTVTNPFLEDTKREVIERIDSEQIVRTAVSCPHHGKQGPFELNNCGQCAPCIVRNLAILSSRFEIPPAELSVCDWSEVDFEARTLPEKTPKELAHRNDRDTFFLALGEIAHFCRHMKQEDPQTVLAEYPELSSTAIYDLHARFANEFETAFQSLSGQNPSAEAFLLGAGRPR